MNNNDRLRYLSNALALTQEEMIEIFSLGGLTVTAEQMELLRTAIPEEEVEETVAVEKCDYPTLESFLNGYVTFKRGEPTTTTGESEKRPLTMTGKNVNNVMIKKLKVALSLSNEDLIDMFEEAGMSLTKGELTPIFRKEGHKHYKKCSDRMIMTLIDGIGIITREGY